MLRFLLLILVGVPAFAQTPRLQLERVVTGFFRPVDIAARTTSEFLVAQTDGQIRLVKQGVIQATPFLDLSAVVWATGWDGIFGITLHPDYDANGYLYVHYARKGDHASVFARYTRSPANPDLADPASAMIVLTVPYPNPGHRSGRIGLGPDGYLYITTGDSAPGVHAAPWVTPINWRRTCIRPMVNCFVSTLTTAIPMPFRPQTRLPILPMAYPTNCTPWVCGIPGGGVSTGKPAISGWVISGRMAGKN